MCCPVFYEKLKITFILCAPTYFNLKITKQSKYTLVTKVFVKLVYEERYQKHSSTSEENSSIKRNHVCIQCEGYNLEAVKVNQHETNTDYYW